MVGGATGDTAASCLPARGLPQGSFSVAPRLLQNDERDDKERRIPRIYLLLPLKKLIEDWRLRGVKGCTGRDLLSRMQASEEPSHIHQTHAGFSHTHRHTDGSSSPFFSFLVPFFFCLRRQLDAAESERASRHLSPSCYLSEKLKRPAQTNTSTPDLFKHTCSSAGAEQRRA